MQQHWTVLVCHTDLTAACTFWTSYLFIYLLASQLCTLILVLLPASTNTSQYKGVLAFGVSLIIHDALESSCPLQTLFRCFCHWFCKDDDTGLTTVHLQITKKGGGDGCVWFVHLHLYVYTHCGVYFIDTHCTAMSACISVFSYSDFLQQASIWLTFKEKTKKGKNKMWTAFLHLLSRSSSENIHNA